VVRYDHSLDPHIADETVAHDRARCLFIGSDARCQEN